jgi:hypothetical protein
MPASQGWAARAGGEQMKQCIQCDREYPDTDNFCEMDGAYLLPVEEAMSYRQESVPHAWGFNQESL